MKSRRIHKIINIVLVTAFLIAAFNIGKIYYDYGKADSTYNGLQKEYVAANKAPESIEIPQEKETAPITIAFDQLMARNKDVAGWLYCPDTVVNYPVVQGEDNDRYLHRDLDGKYLSSGTLFADYRNGAPGDDANYIIYGHNMKNGAMFHILANYKQQSYYDQHPVMYYLTPDRNYKVELFAGLVVKRDDKIYTPNPDSFAELLAEYQEKSTFTSNVILEPTDAIITLSTCSYEFSNARYIVIGRLTSL